MPMDAILEAVREELAIASALRQEIQARIHHAAAETRSEWSQLEANVIEVERAARLKIDDESRGLLARAIVRLRILHASLER